MRAEPHRETALFRYVPIFTLHVEIYMECEGRKITQESTAASKTTSFCLTAVLPDCVSVVCVYTCVCRPTQPIKIFQISFFSPATAPMIAAEA